MKRLRLHAPGFLVVSFSLLALVAACEEPSPDSGDTLDNSAFLEHDALPGTDGETDTPLATPLTCADFDIGGPGTAGGTGSGGGGAGHGGGGAGHGGGGAGHGGPGTAGGTGSGGGGGGGHGGGGGLTPVPLPADGLAQGEELFRGYCASCHTIGRGDVRGPDLQHVYCRPSQWLRQWLSDPAQMRETNPWAQQLAELWDVHMPNPELSPEGIESVIAFMAEASEAGPLEPLPPVELSAEAFEETADLYFNRCAGCHGTYRGGATGPDIGPERSIALGTDTLSATIRHGTPSGMPGLGEMGVVSDEEVAALAAFLQLEPPEAPPLSLDEIRDTWTLLVPPEDRPTEPAHSRDWEDFFGVILRDSGQTAIIDGDTREELVRIDSGFAGHILRSSLSGRYFYAIGRDGWVTMIDLWMDPPTAVAQARGCFDARSVEGSKLESVGEAYVIEGCYWPNQYVVFDGQTLEPLFRGDIQADAVDTGEALSEVRIAVIVASHFNPYWLLALKESGHVAVVDYSAPDFPIIAMLEADRFLHDGGWDHTGRYFMVAANARNRMVVVDAEALEVVAMIDTGAGPHPGRGANWEDPEFGWVNATTHMGEGRLLVYGADPESRPDVAWQVVRDVPLPTAGSLFLKTHPASPWLLIDFPVSQDVAQQRRMCAYSKAEGTIARCWDVSDDDPIVHFEFNAEGTEVWVSIWGTDGEIAIYDAVTLEELGRITGLPTPTGKFNVYNTANDIY